MSVITTSVVASLPLLLPTPEDICEAVRQNKEDECQKLILSCLRYGTSSSSSSPPGDTTQRWKDACNVLEEAWTDVVGSQTSTLFLDVMVDSIWLMVSVSPPSPSSDHSTPWQGETSLVHILQTMLRVAFDIGPQTHSLFAGKLQANLFPAFLDAIGLSSTLPGEDLVKRLRMHNTQVNYKQQKYNLLQEESEGYAKLLHFLSETQTERNRTPLLHIIGTFRLDPNRVLDLALDVLDAKLHQQQQQHPGDRTIGSPQVRRVLDIIRALPHDKLPSLIAFKLSHGETEADGQRRLQTVAFLISHEVLAWRSLMEFFPPIEHDIEEAYNIHWIKEKNRILALTRVSLSGSAGSQEDPKQAEYRERLQAAMKPLEKNSLVNIAFLLICAGKWAEVRPLLSRDLWSRLACLMPRRFGNALCDEALRRTEESYRARVGGPGLNQPWHAHDGSLSSTDTSDMTVDIDSIVSSLWDPLSCIVQSGCIASRPVLFCTICRLLAKLLQATEEGQRCEYSLSSDTFMFFRTFLVPSLSLFPSNPAVSTELWSVLTFLSYPTRYDLYQGWRGMGLERGGLGSSATGKPLPNVLSEMEAGKAARYVLKRLSKDNVRDMSRQLAKVTHANPLVVFATILSQIESYDNMVEVMVEAQRFVNPLGLDVLGYCILGRLSGSTGGVNRSRLKEDGVNVSQWLQSLETFTGEFYKRRPFVEYRGIISYLMTRLKQGNVMELGMLRTLLKTAGGFSFADYSPTASLNETQLKGRSGSLTLTRETMSFGIVEETSARAADRVQAVLQANGLGVSLLILIAQARDQILFDATRGGFKEVKLFGNLYDSCQVVMSILLSFLTSDDFKDTKDGDVSSVASVSTFSECLPSLQELHEQYDLDFESVWFLCRPAVQAALTDNSGKHDKARSCRFELNEGVRHTYSNCLPERVWEFLNPQLVEFFHVNSSHDIYCPEELYRAEISRIQKEIERIKTAKPPPAKSEMDNLGRLQRVSQQLESDLMTQKHHVETTLKQLDEDKSSFFVLEDVSQEAARQFLMHCVYSRSIQGPDDAMYSSAFAFRLHNVWTPGFSIIHYLDELISVTAGALFGVTEGEAANLAILIWESWKVVNEWRYEEKIFDKQVLGKPGSQIEVLVEDERRSDPVSHKDFIELYNKWHSALGNALIGCLTSKEYMHMRTGLVVLTRLVDVFPTRPSVGNKLLKTLEPLQDESTSRPDIRASANAYGMLLLKARDDGKWVEEDEAVAKARAEKEKAAAEQRKKKLERTFQEIERDSEKITAEIGPKDRHDRDRGRDYTARDSGPTDASKGRHGVGRGDENSNSRSSDFARMESGELSGRGRNREDRDRRLAREEDDRGRERGGNSRDERRWQRDAPPRSAKRSRPSTPEMDRDVDRASSKRARLDPDNYSSRRSGSGGGGRGDASPLSRRTRRESPEQPPPRSRARRSRR